MSNLNLKSIVVVVVVVGSLLFKPEWTLANLRWLLMCKIPITWGGICIPTLIQLQLQSIEVKTNIIFYWLAIIRHTSLK